MRTGQTRNFKKANSKTVAILSSCMDDWGGCEELWARSIPMLQQKGFRFIVFKEKINRSHPEYMALAESGVELKELDGNLTKGRRIFNRFAGIAKRVMAKVNLPLLNKQEEPFTSNLKICRPDLVTIAQAINFDALPYAHQCLSLQIPYVIVSQKVADFYWPSTEDRSYMRDCFRNAKKCFFVSQHNLRVTEEQFGTRFNNSQLIYNPVKIAAKSLPFPPVDSGYKLACVGRLFLLDKGQDILLRILAEEKWKSRPVTISFIGTGVDEDGLKAMAKLLEVSNIEFKGQVNGIESLWQEYHALVLPSRSEGLPLVILEAMAAGRPVIITNVGGSAEVVEEGVTGFIGHANEASFGDAMERAWANRRNWEMMGKKASCYIARKLPTAPEEDFSKYINEIINE